MHYLLQGLTGKADANKNGKVSLGELSDFASQKTGLYVARRFNHSQRPFMRVEGEMRAMDFDISPSVPKDFTNSVGMKLVSIPAGEFKMGSSKSPEEIAQLFVSKAEYYKDEHPQHAVRLSKGFYMATTEVTQGQWKAVMGTEPWKGQTFAQENADHAASYISWEDATEYCRQLSQKEGKPYRLPTEAEWEYACRGGTTTVYSFGNDAAGLKDYAWFYDNAYDVGERYAHPVGQKRANAFGLYDMHGNVYEWCSDWYDEDYYGKSPSVDPKGPTSGSSRVLRGGSWYDNAQYCRSADRGRLAPTVRYYGSGFRVVCALD
jgi:formylglycine-generating enzyme required for sulfatase activity